MTQSIHTQSVAVLGAGNMGSAVIAGLSTKNRLLPEQIIVCDKNRAKLDELKLKFGVKVTTSITEATALVSCIILAVKPNDILNVVQEFKPNHQKLTIKPLIISLAAGVELRALASALGECRLARVMPNICSTIGEGVSAVYSNSKEDERITEELFSPLGAVVSVAKECDLDAVTGLSGAGPAFVFQFIEGLADAGVASGLSRETSLLLAIKTVKGSATLIEQAQLHPAQLTDMVASPGGATIVGLLELERGALKATVMNAVCSAHRRAKEMAKEWLEKCGG